MTVLKSLPPIHIHPIMILFILISIITGTFVQLLIIFTIVLLHEMGHYSMARFFKWRIKGIVLWIFGGVMETDEHTTKPSYEEVLVTLAGPFQHVLIYFLTLLAASFDLFPHSINESILYYNGVILLFNLLPIWPLDGGKLLLILLSIHWPYKRAHQLTVMFSTLAVVMLIIGYTLMAPFTLGVYVIAVFLLIENHVERKRHSYIFLRFLLNRYENNGHIRGVSAIEVPSHSLVTDVFALFKREKRHQIYIVFPDQTRKMVDETECLRSYFYDKRHDRQMADIAFHLP
ncbi:Stage IV sporulation protein FB [Lentibacillus sp. JNUCC-1]|uniref:M50 family metallopeptidase n=1 Tax=Lentibacillus sp. JNUCC-1 TaxID=2654513 RepID=UPI0012E900B6|nr:M50 family metallopeptidase [Lentibacillus sp. JNUCC-1]MUV39504.1 Stage IV sporulation protein FB [Lentibacillus sp. JNUCC-1]